MKKLYSFLLGIVVVILVLAGLSARLEAKTNPKDSDKLVIYNWGDYIDPELLKEFTKETGIQVQYNTFDSNEAMYTKIKQGGTAYDIAIPSEYMIAKMMDENLLEKLDKSKLKGLDNIDPRFLNLDFDPDNQYSVPYFWGTLGIIYNTMMYDGAREVMGIGLNSLGYSLNSKDPQQLQESVDKLYTLMPNIKALVADEMKGYMIQNNAAIGVTFSGEARQMLDANEDLRYVVPSEASNLWFDNIVIPKTVKNKEAAYAFIKKMLPKEVQEDQAFYPSDDTLKNLEVYEQLGKKWLGIYNDLYLQVKMYRK